MNRTSSLKMVAAIAIGLTVTAPATAATTCENLASLAFPNTRIDSAQMVAAGAFAPPGARGGVANLYAKLPEFCRVTATLTPTSDSDIKTEIWLPASGWNGKFLAVGNGGWAGTIPYGALAQSLALGYAAAGTDTGHTGNNADFAPGHPEKLIDIAYRSIHEMTVHSKAVINAHYGTPAKLSYYNGCSQGGRQGIAAAQTYPEDFNGIIAGAASWNQMRAHAARTAINVAVNKSENVIPRAKYPMIHEAVLKTCDAKDGLMDGLIENPMKCNFDYSQLMCKAGTSACLTSGQVATAKMMTSPLKDPKTGKVLYEPHLMPGAELGWGTIGGPQPLAPALSGMVNIAKSPGWDYHTMDISKDIEAADKSDGNVMYSGDPNLKPFFDHGGKLLMYHGWTDPQVSPMLSVTYYNNVLKTVGKDKVANSIALFMMPGMNHCQGGAGPDTFGKVNVLEQWVEQGKKPDQIIASHLTDGQVDKTRPICPYPQVARYKGTGSPNDAANFSCVDSR